MCQIFHQARCPNGILASTAERKSQKLCMFNTPFGRYCYRHLPYGITSASEVFHKTVQKIFSDIDGMKVYIDDLVIWGESKEQHDERLFQVLDQAKQVNLTLNLNKCEFRVRKITKSHTLEKCCPKMVSIQTQKRFEQSQKCLVRAQRKMYKDCWAWQIM